MTYPMPDPPQIPGPPRMYSVPLKSCCPDLLEGDECSCLAELVEALTAPCIGPVVAWRDGRVEVTR